MLPSTVSHSFAYITSLFLFNVVWYFMITNITQIFPFHLSVDDLQVFSGFVLPWVNFPWVFFFQDRVISLGDRVRRIEMRLKRMSLCPLFYFLNGRNSQCWAKANAQDCRSIQASHLGGRSPKAWVLFCCPARYVDRLLDRKQSPWDSNQSLDVRWGVMAVFWCTTAPTPAYSVEVFLWT